MSKIKKYSLDDCSIDVYIQKSAKFLYPILKISKTATITPIQTFLCWEGEIKLSACKLICVFLTKHTDQFIQFERTTLLGNEYFESSHKAEDNQTVYVFNLEKHREDFFHFLRGKYSRMSEETKEAILDYYSLSKSSSEYMDSFLNPEKYFSRYAHLLNVPEWRLKEVGELCDPFDRVKETLCIKKRAVSTTTEKDQVTQY